MKNVLIIKLGYSETLDNGLSLTTSLGDVLRTTVILHFFKRDYVSWLVDREASPLLEGNKYIRRILFYDANTKIRLKKERFDIVINLEKLPQICKLADSLIAKEHFGFRSNYDEGYSKDNERLVELSQDSNKRRENRDCWQKVLAEALGKKWQSEPYLLGYKPESEVEYDIGFNWTTSNKWMNKAWPKFYWDELEDLLEDRYSVSWQRGLDSLYEYMDWINSCRLIVTADTLGLHLALALKKGVVALFGPTSPQEIYFYNCGSFLSPETAYECIPCLKPHCDKKKKCIEYIRPEKVRERIKEEFENG